MTTASPLPDCYTAGTVDQVLGYYLGRQPLRSWIRADTAAPVRDAFRRLRAVKGYSLTAADLAHTIRHAAPLTGHDAVLWATVLGAMDVILAVTCPEDTRAIPSEVQWVREALFPDPVALTGWWQCEQYGAEQFRKRPQEPSCSWQGFTE